MICWLFMLIRWFFQFLHLSSPPNPLLNPIKKFINLKFTQYPMSTTVRLNSIHILLIMFLSHLTYCQPQQDKTYMQAQYLKDIEHLADDLMNYKQKQGSENNVLPPRNDPKSIDNTVYFQPETFWMTRNELARFQYETLRQGLIDVRIYYSFIQEKDMSIYPTARDHYNINQSYFLKPSLPYQQPPCKLNDPQIEYKKLRSVLLSQLQLQSKQQTVTILNDHGQYLIIRHAGFNKFDLYSTIIDTGYGEYSRTEIVKVSSAFVEGIQKGDGVFLFGDAISRAGVMSGRRAWRMTVEVNKIIVEDWAVLVSQADQSGQPQTQQQSEQKQIHQVIPLKYGLLIQFQTYFQIYAQTIEQNASTKSSKTTLLPRLSTSHIKKLTHPQSIASIAVSEQLSHQSGYKIYVLLRNGHLLELQYGAYSSINVYKIPYGETFHQLQVKEDVVQVVFSVTKSKNMYLYVMELTIDRKENPRSPKVYVNRFYNDLKDLKKVEFFNDQLIFLGQRDVLVYDWPVDSRILISYNITQAPYHFPVEGLQTLTHLERFSSQGSTCVLLVGEREMTIALLQRKAKSIECSSAKGFDSVIQVLKFCDSNRADVCRYIGSLRVGIHDPDEERMNTVKQYLILGLIVAVVVAAAIVGRQICKNRRTIERFMKFKQSLDRKFRELETKGRKVRQEDKFDQLQEQLPKNHKPGTHPSQHSQK